MPTPNNNITMPNVTFMRFEFAKLLPLYKLISDAISGEVTIKNKGDIYLPRPNASDISQDNLDRYKAYLARAVFYNVARRTLHGLIGQIFLRDPNVKISKKLEPLIADATGTGVNLNQLAKQAVSYNLAYSRAGIFVDYPDVSEKGGATVSDLQGEKIRPAVFVYSPQEIINWRTIEVGAKELLSLVVIFENFIFNDDGFEIKFANQFRVLRLDENGDYVQELWREPTPNEVNLGIGVSKIPNTGYQLYKKFQPKDFNGNPFKEIPFSFIGSENNDTNPDNPNFYDLASLNLAHYRNSADYEEACYMVGQPTLVMTGLTEDWVKNILGGKAVMGSRGGLPLPVGASAELIQAEANTMLKEAMETKERQMVALGAKLVEQKQVQRTATEAGIEAASENSTLAIVAKNVSSAFVSALKWASQFVESDIPEIVFELNVDFDISASDPAQRAEVIKEWQTGAVTFEEMRTVLRKASIATEDDAAAKTKIEADAKKANDAAIALATASKVPAQNNSNP